MTEKNVPLLLATMALIKMFPEKHDQGTWVNPCATTMCFAGHAASISGASFDPVVFRLEEEWILNDQGNHVSEREAHTDDWERKEGYKFVSEFAKDKLGLTQHEADYLFHHGRTREQLEDAVYKFADGYTVNYYGEFTKTKEN